MTGLAHDRTGTGPPLVLLHPLGADRHVWRPVLAHLAAHREVVTVDLPGFGGSAPLPPGVTPTPGALAGAVRAFCDDALGPASWHVAGNSLGGWVALALGLDRAAQTVTAIAPAGLWSAPLAPKPGVARSLARAVAPVIGAATRVTAVRRVTLLGTMAHPERVPPADAAALVRSYGRAPGFTAVNAAMRAGRFPDLDRVGVPVTLVWPEHDRLIARPRTIPAAIREIALPGCGHIPMWDDPGAVAAALLAGSAVPAAAW
ncbi:alpha/beta fold hydrolase [Baekduia soli]|uniref:alpha/beta fold hydrolase n=1 Tax=Baekduia soli TaxID=496014 RepID=UPI00165298C5|nr:alpha/beta fold hydrolase [Baekduia soli]